MYQTFLFKGARTITALKSVISSKLFSKQNDQVRQWSSYTLTDASDIPSTRKKGEKNKCAIRERNIHMWYGINKRHVSFASKGKYPLLLYSAMQQYNDTMNYDPFNTLWSFTDAYILNIVSMHKGSTDYFILHGCKPTGIRYITSDRYCF